ncbi:MAG: hypothetical protein ACP5VS_14795 [Desulfomonilaceae bacterium]
MKTKISMAPSMKLALVIAMMCCVTGAIPALCNAEVVSDPPRAIVKAIQGDANMVVDRDKGQTKLAVGSMVDAWNTVSTNENGKLLLKWKKGILNSIGGSSSIFLATQDTDRGPADVIEMTEGLLRVTRDGGGGAIPISVKIKLAIKSGL